MIDRKYELALVKAFQSLHKCPAKHIDTVPVVETWKGKTVWGDVEVFKLVGHDVATRDKHGPTTRPWVARSLPFWNCLQSSYLLISA